MDSEDPNAPNSPDTQAEPTTEAPAENAEPSEVLFLCPVCPKRITERDKLRIHIGKHMRPMNFKCYVCGERFVIKPDLVRHVKRSHRSGETETRTVSRCQNVILDYTCRLCGFSITSKMTLERHTLEHNNQKDAQFHCRRCLKGFSTHTELTEHREFEHEGPVQAYRLPGPTFECGICKKVLHTKRTHEEHLRLHNKDYHYYCKECNKGFMRKYQLNQHMETPHFNSNSTPAAEPVPPTASESPSATVKTEAKSKKPKEISTLICSLCTKEMPDEEAFYYHTKLHSSDYIYLCSSGKFGDFERKKLIKFLKTYWKNEEQREKLDSVMSKSKVDPEELEELVSEMEQFLRTWLEVDQVLGDSAMMQEGIRVRDGIFLPKVVEKRMDRLSMKYQDFFC